ncbi:hypothetical protein VIGAN_09064000 [Vigna angularis var. angularis]|uniref:Uncharacterized protein n=1 Tax=Vigna angularis var. angularis TaxID=157739 RepID=A0A0S3SWZ5_PHAAN|nr:hypothetical protein VIGAN_09064000 [Vigna angularis var. angularis]
MLTMFSTQYQVNCSMRGDLGPACNSAGMIDRYILGLGHLYRKLVYRNQENQFIEILGYVVVDSVSYNYALCNWKHLLHFVASFNTIQDNYTHTIAMSYIRSSNLTPTTFVKPSPSPNLSTTSRVSSPPTSTTMKPPLTSVSTSSSPSSARATYTRHSPASSPSSPPMGRRSPRPSATTPTTSSSNLTARRTPSCSPTFISSATACPT